MVIDALITPQSQGQALQPGRGVFPPALMIKLSSVLLIIDWSSKSGVLFGSVTFSWFTGLTLIPAPVISFPLNWFHTEVSEMKVRTVNILRAIMMEIKNSLILIAGKALD